MNWQKEKPKRPGWYVTRNSKSKHSKYHVVQVYYEDRKLVAKPDIYNTSTPLSEIKNTEFSWLLLEEE
jgi:hypothetical protein